MNVGDIVVPINDEYPLRCGSGSYPFAVVVSVKPFILTSEEADMLWNTTVEIENFKVRGKATKEMLDRGLKRLYTDYPNHKLHQFMDTIDEA